MAHYVEAFPLSAKLKERLKRCGFTCLDDFIGLKVQELVKEVDGIKRDDAAWILDYVKRIRDPSCACLQPVSAWSLFLSSSSSPSHISTFSRSLDAILDDGVSLGGVTEICGAPGVGKTQLCVQLAVNALVPEVFEGVGGNIVVEDNGGDNVPSRANSNDLAYVYVFDTEGSFVPRRIFEIAEATVDHFKRLAETLDPEDDRDAVNQARAMNAEGFCDRILISRCLSLEELLAGVKHLRSIVQQRRVSLVIIDSLAMHFRQEVADLSFRTRILNGLVQDLMQIAVGMPDRPATAVVLTNQMTTKIYSDRHKSSHLVPALGESWGHAPTHRLLLHSDNKPTRKDRDDGLNRLATIFKSPSHSEQTVPFQVTSGGIRDAAESPDGTARVSSKSICGADAQLASTSSACFAEYADGRGKKDVLNDRGEYDKNDAVPRKRSRLS